MNTGDGRPLRFLALVGCCWIGARFALVLNTTGSLPAAARAIVPLTRRSVAIVGVPSRVTQGVASPTMTSDSRQGADRQQSTPFEPIAAVSVATVPADVVGSSVEAMPLPARTVAYPGEPPPVTVATIPAGGLSVRDPIPIRQVSRLSISSWLIARGWTGLSAVALAPQLGGTQAGARFDYAVGNGFAATGRIAAPARGIGREVSLGVAWRPSAIPVRIVAEQRVALDGGKGGPALGISGGVSAVRLPAQFRLEGYAQAGAIARVGIETYADASVRAARPIAEIGSIAVDLGAGAWGGAQRGAARLDVGPSIGARIPVAGQPLRVAIDWRQRVAGNARPGSGPALTLGTDF